MKKIYALVMGMIMISFLISLSGCPPKGTPLALNFNPTATFTLSPTPTFTSVPGSPTPTMTPIPWVLYNATGGFDPHAGGTPNFYTSGATPARADYYNPAATDVTPYGTDTKELSYGVVSWGSDTFSTLALNSGAGATNISAAGFTKETFYAEASAPVTGAVDFYALNGNACLGCTYLGMAPVTLSTSWQQFSVLFSTDAGAATDEASLTNVFSVGINNGATAPITVFLDNLQYQ